jgi:Uma2 family endonuclease
MLSEVIEAMSVAEFEDFVTQPHNITRNFEWIAGEIVEKMVAHPLSARTTMALGSFVTVFVINHNLGVVSSAEGGYVVSGERYIPDCAFLSNAKRHAPSKDGYVLVAPDLAIEVVSPTDQKGDITSKVANYLAAGTVVWLVRPIEKTVHVYQANQPVKVYHQNDTLLGGDVLPGFSLTLKLIFQNDENLA